MGEWLTLAREEVLRALERYNGDVGVVARELGVSESYVRKVRMESEVLAEVDDSESAISKWEPVVLDIGEMRSLGQLVVKKLIEEVSREDFRDVGELRKVLGEVARYDIALRGGVRSQVVNVDARMQSVHLGELVNRLSAVPEGVLREVVDGAVKEG